MQLLMLANFPSQIRLGTMDALCVAGLPAVGQWVRPGATLEQCLQAAAAWELVDDVECSRREWPVWQTVAQGVQLLYNMRRILI